MADLKAFAEQLVNLSVKEVQELAEILKQEHGIEPVSAAAVVAQPSVGGEEVGEAEKTKFDVIINSPGGAKLQIVKLVKEITGLGLKESKALVDASPKAMKEGVSKEEAESLKAKFEEAGAEIELK